MHAIHRLLFFFFFNDTATTEIYTLSLHDALPIFRPVDVNFSEWDCTLELADAVNDDPPSNPIVHGEGRGEREIIQDRKSTRLNSSHANISYAVFCLKKKKKRNMPN